MDILPSAHAAALWVGLNLIILLVLSMLVVRLRRKHRVALGDDGIPELARAIRAFGNASEYIPSGLIALVALAIVGAWPPLIHAAGLVLFLGRLIHAVGLSNSGGASIPRAVGTSLTWLAYVFCAAAALFYAVA